MPLPRPHGLYQRVAGSRELLALGMITQRFHQMQEMLRRRAFSDREVGINAKDLPPTDTKTLLL
jgi:hypothetical protein